jgi:phage repressor protein C with HTH and peptisase S24 domain
MTQSDPRLVLDELIQTRGEDYASLSRLIGRNSAYIQQFIKRGVPRKLDEADRTILANYFGIDENLLGAPVSQSNRLLFNNRNDPVAYDLIAIPTYAIRASAGAGRLNDEVLQPSRYAFSFGYARELAHGNSEQLSLIQVSGDSMMPTLCDGDDLLVDHSDAAGQLRDGIYVLRRDELLHVKRIVLSPVGGSFTIRSDNPIYPEWHNLRTGDVDIVGRAVWTGRRLS